MAAMDYIFAKAQQLGDPPGTLPCAINMSFGGHLRSAQRLLDRLRIAIDAALAGTTGRAVIVGGSNDREGNLHIAETVAAGTTTTINLVVEAKVPARRAVRQLRFDSRL